MGSVTIVATATIKVSHDNVIFGICAVENNWHEQPSRASFSVLSRFNTAGIAEAKGRKKKACDQA